MVARSVPQVRVGWRRGTRSGAKRKALRQRKACPKLSAVMPNFEMLPDRRRHFDWQVDAVGAGTRAQPHRKVGFGGSLAHGGVRREHQQAPDVTTSNRTTGMALFRLKEVLTEVLGYTYVAARRLRPNSRAPNLSAAEACGEVPAVNQPKFSGRLGPGVRTGRERAADQSPIQTGIGRRLTRIAHQGARPADLVPS